MAAIVLLAGFCLRLMIATRASGELQWIDEQQYLALAQRLTAGEGYSNEAGAPTAFRPPGYPFLLAGLGALGLDSAASIRCVQVLLGTLTIWLIFLLGQAVFGTAAGITAAAVAAVYPYFLFIPATLLPTTWITLLVMGATLCLIRAADTGSILDAACSGLLFSAAILTRPSFLLLLLAAILWSLVRCRKIVPVLLLICTILTLPWAIRNAVRVDRFHLSTNGGRNLWLGNNPGTSLNPNASMPIPRFLEISLENAQTEGERDRLYSTAAWNHIKESPGRYATLALAKGAALWRWDPSPTTGGYLKVNRSIRWISILSFGPLFLFAIIGVASAPAPARSAVTLWLLYALGLTVVHALFFAKVRFRIPLDGFIILAAAAPMLRCAQILYRIAGKFGSGITTERTRERTAHAE